MPCVPESSWRASYPGLRCSRRSMPARAEMRQAVSEVRGGTTSEMQPPGHIHSHRQKQRSARPVTQCHPPQRPLTCGDQEQHLAVQQL